MDNRGSQRAGGLALLGAAAGTVVAMGHHPSGAEAGSLVGIVHGAMILFIALNAFGFGAMAGARGIMRPSILAGGIVYAISLVAHVGAATINGFVVPALVPHGANAVGQDIFLFAWESNQALARLGVVATGLAFLLWSLPWVGHGSKSQRFIGIAGLIAGVVPIAMLFGGVIRLNVAGAFVAYALHAAWGAMVGWLMLTNRLGEDQ